MVILLTEIMQLSMNQGYSYFTSMREDSPSRRTRFAGLAVQAGALRGSEEAAVAVPGYVNLLSKIFPRRAVSTGDDSAAWFAK
jgi:hypothetical protein